MKGLLKRVFTGEIKGIDEKEHTLTAYVSTGARDRMDEVLSPDGVDLKAYKKNPVVLWAHNYQQPPIGKALWIKRDGEGIVSKVKFANTEFAQEVFELYKDGYMKAFSVGFIPKEHEDGDGKKTPRRTYTKWEMLEYSAVPVPANPEALTLAIQKGVLKNEKLKEMLKPEKKEEWCKCVGNTEWERDNHCTKCGLPIKPPVETEEEKAVREAIEMAETAKLDVTDPPVAVEPSPNPELLEQVKAMQVEISQLKNTNLELRYKILQAEKVDKEKSLSEMTDDEILSKIEGEVIRVIRKVTGKVN